MIEPLSHQVLGWHVIGGAGDQHVAALAADEFANLYVAGGFEGELSLDGGAATAADGQDGFFARFANDGATVLSALFRGPDRQVATALTVTPDGGAVVTGARGTMGATPGYVDLGDEVRGLRVHVQALVLLLAAEGGMHLVLDGEHVAHVARQHVVRVLHEGLQWAHASSEQGACLAAGVARNAREVAADRFEQCRGPSCSAARIAGGNPPRR